MRMLIAVLAMPLFAACSLTLAPLPPGGGQNCRSGSNASGARCNSPAATVITIGPSHQYTDNSDALCFQFSPVVASMQVGGSYSFQNNTSSPITILGADQAPWVTVDAGSTSAAINFPNVGVYSFGVQGCRGVGGTAWYGVLAVTTN
jgi:hypothetical protein